MRLVHLNSSLYRLPLMGMAEDALHGKINCVELILVEIITDNGLKGCGYTYTIGTGGLAIKCLIDDSLAGLLTGEDPQMIEQLWHKMWWHLHWVGRGGLAAFAIAAVDIALWDLLGKATALPLYRLLGGYSKRIPMYGSGVDLNLSDDELVSQVEGFLAEGFRAVKIKVGRDNLEDDLRRVKLVRQAIGNDIQLMVDANMKWQAAQAIYIGKRLEEYNICWLEEPLIPDDLEGYRQVAYALDVPVAAGENLHNKYEFKNYLLSGALDVVQLDVITVGGITEWRKVSAMAETFNLPLTSHYAEEIQVHLLAASPNSWYAERHAFRLDPVLKKPLALKDGMISPPEVPGHGLEFDLEKLAQHRVVDSSSPPRKA
jgi:L-alanine-DL-glutamate epimerase-like enolase superfamily enzyme